MIMQNRMSGSTLYAAQGAVTAALYVSLTLLSQMLGLTSLAVQIRFSEALCVLPFFGFAAVPGLTIGCVLANLLLGSAPWDVVFGSLATLLGALACYYVSSALKKRGRGTLAPVLSPVPNILSNTLILPFIIKWVYFDEMSMGLLFLFVFLGEAASCLPGIPIAYALRKRIPQLFK